MQLRSGGSSMLKGLACVATVLILGGCAARPTDERFTVVVLPDTQFYSKDHPEIFRGQTEWIRRNVEAENIVFVTHLGDVVQDRGKEMGQWEAANEAMSILDGAVPWGITIGNHDYDRSDDPAAAGTIFARFFGPQRFCQYAWFGGATENGLNSYQLFSGGGRDFLIFHIQVDMPDDVIAWAESVLERYPDRAAIITTHVYLRGREGVGRHPKRYFREYEAGNSAEDIWSRFISKQPQIFMVLCGHESRTVEYYQVSKNEAGAEVLEILADYQRRKRGGEGYLRLMQFDLPAKKLHVRTYSPDLDQFENDESSEFTLPLELPEPQKVAAAVSMS